MKKMKPVFLLLLALCQFVHSRFEDFFVIVPSKLKNEEMICTYSKKVGSKSTVTGISEIETNDQISTYPVTFNGYRCLSIQSGKLVPNTATSGRLTVRVGGDINSEKILDPRDITLDNEEINKYNELEEAFPIFSHQRKKRSIEDAAKRQITNNLYQKLQRRELRDVEFSNRFSTFADKSDDLEVPNQIAGIFQIFAMPPSNNKGQETCPHCLKTPADDFLKLYCSSQLGLKVEFIGRGVMYLLQNHSPMTNSTELRRLVLYTIKHRCQCEFSGHEIKKQILFMLVTPPRKFNVDSIQALHLDENITLFPWQSVQSYLLKMKNGPSCIDILTSSK